MWQGHKNALFEAVVAIANTDTGELVSRVRIPQSAERREQLMAENAR